MASVFSYGLSKDRVYKDRLYKGWRRGWTGLAVLSLWGLVSCRMRDERITLPSGGGRDVPLHAPLNAQLQSQLHSQQEQGGSAAIAAVDEALQLSQPHPPVRGHDLRMTEFKVLEEFLGGGGSKIPKVVVERDPLADVTEYKLCHVETQKCQQGESFYKEFVPEVMTPGLLNLQVRICVMPDRAIGGDRCSEWQSQKYLQGDLPEPQVIRLLVAQSMNQKDLEEVTSDIKALLQAYKAQTVHLAVKDEKLEQLVDRYLGSNPHLLAAYYGGPAYAQTQDELRASVQSPTEEEADLKLYEDYWGNSTTDVRTLDQTYQEQTKKGENKAPPKILGLSPTQLGVGLFAGGIATWWLGLIIFYREYHYLDNYTQNYKGEGAAKIKGWTESLKVVGAGEKWQIEWPLKNSAKPNDGRFKGSADMLENAMGSPGKASTSDKARFEALNRADGVAKVVYTTQAEAQAGLHTLKQAQNDVLQTHFKEVQGIDRLNRTRGTSILGAGLVTALLGGVVLLIGLAENTQDSVSQQKAAFQNTMTQMGALAGRLEVIRAQTAKLEQELQGMKQGGERDVAIPTPSKGP